MVDARSPAALILARTMPGAQAAARLVSGDVLSVVDDQMSAEAVERASAEHPSEVLIECDPADLTWLRAALGLARSIAGPATSVRLVITPGSERSDLEEPLAETFAGWAVTGIAMDGDVTSLTVRPTSEDLPGHATVEGIQGALLIEETLRTVIDPASSDLEDFEYRSSLILSYLREIPRLHAEIEELRSDLEQAKAGGHSTHQSRRPDRERPTAQVDTTRSPQPVSPSPARQRRRVGKLALVVVTAVLWAALATAVAAISDLGRLGFLVLLVLGVVLGGLYDSRRRAMTLLRVARQAAAGARSVQRIEPLLDLNHQEGLRATNETVSRQAEATKNHVSQVGSQLASGMASSARDVVGQVVAAVDTTARQAADQTAAETTEILKTIPRAWDLRAMVRAELLTTYQQLEANLQLRDLVDVTGPTPQLRGWAASPDVLVFLVQELRRLQPELVVECGSGASTVWLAMACRSAQLPSKIVALEHEPVFAAETSRLLAECGVDNVAEVRLAPLEEVLVNDQATIWYSEAALDGLEGIGLVFVDGPPGTTTEHARYPALPILRRRLAPIASVVLDDVIRENEQVIADMWKAEFPEMSLATYKFEKGAAVFRLSEQEATSD